MRVRVEERWRCHAGRLILPGLLGLCLGACAAAEVPMPFGAGNEPEPATTAATPPASSPPAAPAASGEAPPAGVQHGPARADLAFPRFAPPAAPGPVMNDVQQQKMQSDLEALAKQSESKMRREIEADQ